MDKSDLKTDRVSKEIAKTHQTLPWNIEWKKFSVLLGWNLHLIVIKQISQEIVKNVFKTLCFILNYLIISYQTDVTKLQLVLSIGKVKHKPSRNHSEDFSEDETVVWKRIFLKIKFQMVLRIFPLCKCHYIDVNRFVWNKTCKTSCWQFQSSKGKFALL